jgi:hypothetical protein
MTLFTPITRRLAYTPDQLDALATEFAEYAALDIADIVKLDRPPPERDYQLALIGTEIAHAIRCTLDALTVTANPPLPYRSSAPRLAHEFRRLKVERA